MTFLNILLGLLALISLSATIASMLNWDYWWIRMFDFPRLQITFITLAAMAIILFQLPDLEQWLLVLSALLFFSLIYQLIKIYPYTFLSKKQVKSYRGEDPLHSISL